jgi:hypothetical protein
MNIGLRGLLGVVLLCACGDDDDGPSTSSGLESNTSTASESGSESSADGGGSMSGSTSGSTGSSTGEGTGATVDDTGADSGSDGATTGTPTACGDLECGADEICIAPCCGGPAPFCGPARGDACPRGTHPVDSCQFGGECGPGQLCCEDDPCVADPPYCAPTSETMCMDDPNSPRVQCSSPCFGRLTDGTLSCECA